MPRLKTTDLTENIPETESSLVIAKRITKARILATKRLGKGRANADMTNSEIQEHARISASAKELLGKAIEELSLSGRAYFRTLKVARTIADLDGSDGIHLTHIAEALGYRKHE